MYFLVLSVLRFGVSSVYSFALLYSLLFGYITVITITHVMRMTHMHHHSSWFLVCETIRERRRRHHRDHGWPQAADTPSSFFFGGPTGNASAAPQAEASRMPIRIMPNTRTRQRFNRIQTLITPNSTGKRAQRPCVHTRSTHKARRSRGHPSATH